MSKNSSQFVLAYIKLARPHQWNKNLIVFAPLLFSEKWSAEAVISLVATFIIFALLSSSVYALNDVLDRNRDALHPLKSQRPIAAGDLSVRAGLIFSALTMLCALTAAIFLNHPLAFFALLYALCALLYSILLKHLPLIDIATITGMLLIRLFSGAAVINIVLSNSIILATLSLGLMLATGKRLIELRNYPHSAKSTRSVLNYYSLRSLTASLYLFAALSIAIYSYWLYQYQQPKFNSPIVWLTLLPVIFSISRYLFLLNRNQFDEDPAKGVITDVPIFISALTFTIFHSWLLLSIENHLNPFLLGTNSSIQTTLKINQDSSLASAQVKNIGSNTIKDLSLNFPLLQIEIPLASSLEPQQSMRRSILNALPKKFSPKLLGAYVIRFRDSSFKEHQQLYVLEEILNSSSIEESFSYVKEFPLSYWLNLSTDFEIKYTTNNVSAKLQHSNDSSQRIVVNTIPAWIDSFQVLLANGNKDFVVINFSRMKQIPTEFFLWIFLACLIPLLKVSWRAR